MAELPTKKLNLYAAEIDNRLGQVPTNASDVARLMDINNYYEVSVHIDSGSGGYSANFTADGKRIEYTSCRIVWFAGIHTGSVLVPAGSLEYVDKNLILMNLDTGAISSFPIPSPGRNKVIGSMHNNGDVKIASVGSVFISWDGKDYE